MRVERGPYGRQDPIRISLQHYEGESYYGQPVLKTSHYGQLIAGYLFIGGMAGAGQIIATIADLRGSEEDRPIVRGGRYLALAASLVSPVLLIADLETPSRWYNMLRIFRPTSPMSIGAWTLAGFGTLSGTAVITQELNAHRKAPFYARAARYSGLLAALFGAGMATYTGTLLAATSTPLWARANELLPALFAASSMATAAAALSLLTVRQPGTFARTEKLEWLAMTAMTMELFISMALKRRLRKNGLATILLEEKPYFRYGYKAVGIFTPLVIHALSLLSRRRSRLWSITAAAATLAGGYFLRTALISAGNASARRATAYLRSTQPRDCDKEHRPAKNISLIEQCQAAIDKLDRARHLTGREMIPQIDEVELMIVALRDAIIMRLRQANESHAGGQGRAALERINAVLSLIVGLEYPIAGINYSILDQARNLLTRVIDDGLLTEEPSGK